MVLSYAFRVKGAVTAPFVTKVEVKADGRRLGNGVLPLQLTSAGRLMACFAL